VVAARPELPGSTNAPTVGLVIQQYPSSGDGVFAGKTVSAGAQLREVVVEGKKGYWIDGGAHSIAYFRRAGHLHRGQRCAGRRTRSYGPTRGVTIASSRR
jgi:hypothetical protein